MAISNHAELEHQPTLLDLLLARSVEAVALAPSFFYELLYSKPLTGNKSPLQAIASNWLGFWREKQAERIVLFLLILLLIQAHLWLFFWYIRFVVGRIWAVLRSVWNLVRLWMAFCESILASVFAVFNPGTEKEPGKVRIIAVNERLGE